MNIVENINPFPAQSIGRFPFVTVSLSRLR